MRTSGIRTSRDRTSGGPPVFVSPVGILREFLIGILHNEAEFLNNHDLN